MTLALRLARQQVFGDVGGASHVISAMLSELSSVLGPALWAAFGSARVRLDGEVLEPLLAESRFLHGDRDDQPTHAVRLFSGPTGATMGILTMNVRAQVLPDTAPGLTLSVSIPNDDIGNDTADLARRLDACAQAISADVALLGPKSFLRDFGVGAITFAKRAPSRDKLPHGAQVIVGRSGDFIIAHPESPASESTAARAAIEGVRHALDPRAPVFPAPAPPVEVVAPTPALPPQQALPIAPVAAESESRWGRWVGVQNVAATVGVDDSALRQAILPFLKGAPTPQFFAEADAARPDTEKRSAAPAGAETLELGASLPIPGSKGDPAATIGIQAAPSLSLEQYAAFCAELSVFPAKSASIHQRYGVLDPAKRKALDETFALRFRADPTQRQRWQALIVHYGDWFRTEAAKKGP